MLRQLALGAVLATTLLPAPQAIAVEPAQKTLVARETGSTRLADLAYKPHSLRSEAYVWTGIKWRTYDGPVALGTAVMRVDRCYPLCPEPRWVVRKAELRLYKRQFCDEEAIGAPVYMRLEYRIFRDLPEGLGRRFGRFSMRPLFEPGDPRCV